MLETTPASPGLLFGSFLFQKSIPLDLIRSLWEEEWGPSFSLAPTFNPLVKYYSSEMGTDLGRVFFLTSRTYPRDFLLSGKLRAMDWERERAVEGRRTVNIDIGFLSAENFQLATTKNFSHRVYLGQNIFSDLTFYFHLGQFQSLPWTYPDYLDEEKLKFLTWGRSFLLNQLS